MIYERSLQSVLLEELPYPTPGIQVLIGHRQGGRTPMACQIQESIGIRAIPALADGPVSLF